MNRRILALALFALAALPLRADFNDVVREVSSQHGLHDFQLATFEGRGGDDIDGPAIGELLARNAGAGFRPIVRVQSHRRGSEWTFIYVRPVGETFELMVATHDHRDTTVVRAVVDVDRLQRAVNESRRGKVMASLR